MGTRSVRSFFLGLAILAVGVIGLMIFIALKPDPPREESVVLAPIVRTQTVTEMTGSLVVRGSGTVSPAREVNLAAEVPGRIVSVSPQYVNGGTFAEGEVILIVDPSDYENAVAVVEAEVTERQLNVMLAEEESAIAADEWQRLLMRDGETTDAPESSLGSLVLREPQKKLAEAVLKGAEARLSDARSRLSRTAVRAPFTGKIRSKLAEVGQYVAPGTVVASFFGTDQVEITTSLPTGDAALISDLFTSDSAKRIPARVQTSYGGRTYRWDGYVHRTEGALDPATRMYRIVVRVDQPYKSTGERPPLLVGMYASVEIEGISLESYFRIPREAIRDESGVWTVVDGRLRMRRVHIVQEVDDFVVVDEGLMEGDRIVVSMLSVVSDGMKVRTAQSSVSASSTDDS